MMPTSLRELTIAALIERFANDAAAQDLALTYENFDAFSDLMKDMTDISEELKSRGEEARLQLLSLYKHPNIQVQLQAARATLSVAPIAARREIEAIASSQIFPQAGDAGMTLAGLDGKLKAK